MSALVHRDIRRLTRREGARTRDRIRDALATAGADGLTTDAVAEAVVSLEARETETSTSERMSTRSPTPKIR